MEANAPRRPVPHGTADRANSVHVVQSGALVASVHVDSLIFLLVARVCANDKDCLWRKCPDSRLGLWEQNMHTHSMQLTSSPSISIKWSAIRTLRRMRALLLRCLRFLQDCADHFAAATEFDSLSRLPDAALERRGIARGDLHRHVAEAYLARRNSR